MDTAGPIPSPSAAWSRLAVPLPADLASEPERAIASGAAVRHEDAAQLKARLLRMIVKNEQSRKSAANETYNGR
jgi:hypothetical protein